MVIRNIKQGDSYVEALMNQNGFLDKASCNVSSLRMQILNLWKSWTETQAAAYVGSVDLANFEGLNADYTQQLQNVLSEIEDVVADSVEESVEGAVEDAVEIQLMMQFLMHLILHLRIGGMVIFRTW